MSENCEIVPWFDRNEWLKVYDKIYSDPTISSKQEALEVLLIWKSRCPSLPAGIESTLSILEVHVQDSINAVENDQVLRLAYSSAIMRFVNHMLDVEIAKGISFHQAARILGVPDWIIDLRHDTAHNNILPSIEILREASSISLEWLQNNYWNKHKEFIKDFVVGPKEIDDTDGDKINLLLNFCSSLSICASPRCKIRNLNDIKDANMQEAIVNDARDLFGSILDFSNLKTVSIVSLINLLNSNAKKLLKSKNTTFHVNKALTGEDSLFLSSELLNYLSESDFHSKSKLSSPYVHCFEVLLIFLQRHDLLMDFVLELIKITQDDDKDCHKRKLAALWVSEILKSLKKSVLFCNKIDGSNQEFTQSKKKKELRLLFNHWFPNEKNSALLLDLHITIPNEWMDIKFIQPIISAYNPYLVYFIQDLLNLVHPSVPKTNVEKICKLAKLISTPDYNSAKSTSKIYTLDDLQSYGASSAFVQNQDLDSDCMEVCEDIMPEARLCDRLTETQFQNGIWQKASHNYSWSTCPFGLLPWQMQNRAYEL